MKDFTILVNSCDKYSDAWEPFFKLLKIYWPECVNYRIILNSETKVFNCNFLNVETVCGGHATWSKRLKNVLKKIDSEIVVFLLEDFFLKSTVNQNAFQKTLEAMLEDKTIGYIGLKYRPDRKLKNGFSPDEHFVSRDLLPVKYRLPLVSSMWNRDYFIKIIRDHETPWEFEEYAGIRSKKYNYKVLDINNNTGFFEAVFDYNIDMQYGIGIAKGKWLMPKTKEFLDQYGIEVDYNNLGVDYETYYKANNIDIEGKNDLPTPPKALIKKNFLLEFAYSIKHFLKNLIKKSKKYIRKIKSTI